MSETCKICWGAARGGRLDVAELARQVLGRRWRSASPHAARVRVTGFLARDGACLMHLSWVASCIAHRIEQEQLLRSIAAGDVEVRYVALDHDSEPVTGLIDELVAQARAFVAGSSLSGLLEVDEDYGRIRLSLQLAGTDPPEVMVVHPTSLALGSASEIVDALRQRQLRSLAEAG